MTRDKISKKIKIDNKEIDIIELKRGLYNRARYAISYKYFNKDFNKAHKLVKQYGGRKYTIDNNLYFVFKSFNIVEDLKRIFDENNLFDR